MFLYCRDTLQLSEACIQSLSASLNAPVVHTEDLPPGPARAAIVVFAEEYGDFGLAVGLRALESGDVALYKYRARVQSAEEVPAAMEDALSFAEGLGFLFDEDMIDRESGAGRQEALEHWSRLMGKGEVFRPGALVGPPSPAASPDAGSTDDDPLAPADELAVGAQSLDGEAAAELMLEPDSESGGSGRSELLLDDLMDFADESHEGELSLEGGDELLGQVELEGDEESSGQTADILELALEPAPRAPAAPPLSKFRRQEGAARPQRQAPPVSPGNAEEDPDAAGQRALGRIAIVKRRSGGGDSAWPSVLTRLLSSF